MRRTRPVSATLALMAVLSVGAGVLAPATVAGAVAESPASPGAAPASFTTLDDAFFDTNAVMVEGIKSVGSTLFVMGPDGTVYCTVDDPATTSWACPPLSVPNGSATFTGVETIEDDGTRPLDPITVRILGPPRIDGGGSAAETAGRFTGSAEPNALIRIRVQGAAGTIDRPCPDALPDGFWSCIVEDEFAPSGRYTARAGQADSDAPSDFSNYSAEVSVLIDRTRPASPVVTAPAAGARTIDGRFEARGTGEVDALLQVFANGFLVCETVVARDGSWICPVALPTPDDYGIQMLQRDRADNFSTPTPAIAVVAGSPAPGRPSAPPSPARPTPEPSPSTPPSETPAPTSPDTEPSIPPTQPAEPPFAEPPLAAPSTNWGTPTGFGSSLPTLARVAERGGLLIGALLALGYLLLIALPMRAFATIALPRLRSRGPSVLGRNRPAVVDTEPLLSPRLTAAAVFGVAALLAALSGSVAWEVRYLRLSAAIGLGLLVLNVVAVALSARLAGRVWRAPVAVQLLPGILFAAAVAAMVTRFGDLRPALLVGVLVVASAAGRVRLRARVGVAAAQLGGVALLTLFGWAAHDLLTPSTGFWMTLWSETAAAITLGGLGSLLLLLLPVSQFPGRAVYAVSKPLWATAALLAAAVAGAVVAAGAQFPLITVALIATATAAVLMAITSWVRWVEPAMR